MSLVLSGTSSFVHVDRDADVELLQEVGWEALLETERDNSATFVLGELGVVRVYVRAARR